MVVGEGKRLRSGEGKEPKSGKTDTLEQDFHRDAGVRSFGCRRCSNLGVPRLANYAYSGGYPLGRVRFSLLSQMDLRHVLHSKKRL